MTDDTPTLEQLLGLDAAPAAETSATQDGKGLRAQLQAVLNERKQLAEQLATYRERDRVRTVADLVTKHSIPSLAQDLLLKEIGDGEPTDEAVTAFVAKYGELWGAKAAEASTTPEQQQSAAQVQALAALASAQGPGALFDPEVATSRYAEAKSKEDVLRMVAEQTAGLQLLE